MGWSARLSACCICLVIAVPTAISASANIQFISLSASGTLTCGVAANGSLYCWGSDRRGLIGEDERDTGLPLPSPIAPEIRFQSVSVGDSILCGIATSGRAYCWGSALAARKPVVVSESLTFRSVSSGFSSACGVTTNGVVYCWGLSYSHANDVAEFHNNVPVRIQARASFDVVSSSTGQRVACGIANDGAGYCWGQDLGGQAEPGAEHNFVALRVKGEVSYRTVSAGRSGALAIGRDGITYSWSYDDLTPKALNISVRLATIDIRGDLLCATDTAGAGYCWGNDRDAYLGSGSRGEDSGPQQLFGRLTFSSMTVGLYHACGLTTEGGAYCWGNSDILGNGLPGDWSIPTPVANPGVTPVAGNPADGSTPFRSDLADTDQVEKRLAAQRELNSKRLIVMIEAKSGEQLVGAGAGVIFFAGLDRAYIVTAYHLIRPEQKVPLSIHVRFWSKPEQPLEAKVTGDWDRSLDLVVLRVSGINGLGLDLYSMPFDRVDRDPIDKGDEVYHLGNPGGRTWGSNVTADHFLEVRGPFAYFESSSIRPGVSGGALLDKDRNFIGMVRADESGEGEAVLWRTIEDRLRDWGYPVYLGSPPPAPAFISAAVVGDSNFGVTTNHAVYSWPEDASDPSQSMARIEGLNFDWIGTEADEWGWSLCGLADNGDAYCWSDNVRNASGDQVLGVPMKVPGGKRFRSLTKGDLACGLTSEGEALCWGPVKRALGDGSIRSSDRPVAVYGNRRFKSISSGTSHTCGVDQDGALYCWGENTKGDLGQSSVLSSDLPVQVPSKLRFKLVSCGADSTCAITEDGKAYCWGGNENGQLGNGTEVDSIAPVEVLASSKFQMISVGDAYACAITSDGAAVCWGLNGDGELGNNTFKSSSVPVAVAGSLRFSSVAANYSRTIGITTSGAAYTWGREKNKTDDRELQHSSVPRAAPRDSDFASVEAIVAYRMDGDYGKAEQAAEEAIQRYPDSPFVVYKVALLFADVGKSDRTQAGIRKLRDLGENRAALLRTAFLELRIKDFHAMAQDLDRAEKLSKSDDEIREVRLQRANSYSDMEQLAIADAEYQKILSQYPHNLSALNDLAYNLAQENGPWQAAYDMAAAAVASDPESSNHLDTLGFICNRMSRFPEAREHLEHALANQGVNNPDILEHIGDTYSKLGDAAGAQAMWRNALQRREAEAPNLRKPAIMERLQQKLAARPK
jgi:alpha-tubulin suppressor-like RCC1 family protein/tetratricopeptide (TPR) repeat protein